VSRWTEPLHWGVRPHVRSRGALYSAEPRPGSGDDYLVAIHENKSWLCDSECRGTYVPTEYPSSYRYRYTLDEVIAMLTADGYTSFRESGLLTA